MDTVYLIRIFGLIIIFLIGTLLSKPLSVNVTAPNNPLATLGRILAIFQAFYIPVFNIDYMYIPEYIPFKSDY
ncbi:DUF7010 family protein [Neobacillus vireti]|uniref:DUF7010 family protein n=1 Tax=Neobacillus vireti TaxID=220686 RepID=UPI003B589E3B